MIEVKKSDIELIAKIEALGTWEDETTKYNIWSWNGNTYKIYK